VFEINRLLRGKQFASLKQRVEDQCVELEMPSQINKPREYRDMICWMILNSPDRWQRDYMPKDKQYSLDSVFQVLIDGLPATKRQLKDESKHPIIIEMLKMSRESFRSSFKPIYNVPYFSDLLFKKQKHLHTKKAIYILQEVMGIIWPSQQMPEKYESEARKALEN
jgi:hypothetical protein